MNRITLILVANSSEAKLFTTEKIGHDLALYREFKHLESREKISNVVTDKNGHYQSNNGSGQGSYVEQHDPKEVAAERFAHELAIELNAERLSNQFHDLILIAPPKFHGLLNHKCHHDVRNMVSYALQKDYTKIPEKDLNSHLLSLVSIK